MIGPEAAAAARAVARTPEVLAVHRRRLELHLGAGEEEAVVATLVDAFRGLPTEARIDRADLLRLGRRAVPAAWRRPLEGWVAEGIRPVDPVGWVPGTVLPTGFGPDGLPVVRAPAAPAPARAVAARSAVTRPARPAVAVAAGILVALLVGCWWVVSRPTADPDGGGPAAAVPAAPSDDGPATTTGNPAATSGGPQPADPGSGRRGTPAPADLPGAADPAAAAAAFAHHWAWLLANPDPADLARLVDPASPAYPGARAHLAALRTAGEAVEVGHLEARGRLAPGSDPPVLVVDLDLADVVVVDGATGAVLRPGGPDVAVRLRLVAGLRDGWRVTSVEAAGVP